MRITVSTKTLVFVLLYLLLGLSVANSQDKTIDSLKLALKNAKHDTTRCTILNTLAETASEEEWPGFNEELYKLAQKKLEACSPKNPLRNFYLKCLATATNNKGVLYNYSGETAKAIDCYSKSLKMQEEVGDKNGVATSLNNIGLIYQNQGNIPLALEYYSKSLKMREALNDKIGIAYSLNNIGLIYKDQQEAAKALDCFTRSLHLQEELADRVGVANSLTNIGVIYVGQKKTKEALACYTKSLKIRQEIGDKRGESYSLTNIGLLYFNQPDYAKAIENWNKALFLQEAVDDKRGVAYSLNNLSGVFFLQNNYGKAQELALRSLAVSKEIGYPENTRNAAATLSKIYKAKKDFKNSFLFYELFVTMRDSINNRETKKASIKNQLKYEYEKRAAADSVKNAEEKKVKDAQLSAQSASLKQEKTQRYALYGGLLLIVGFLVFVYNRYRVTQKQKKIIEEQKFMVDEAYEKLAERNKEVMDSIHYAKRIQTALLPNEKYIDKVLRKRND